MSGKRDLVQEASAKAKNLQVDEIHSETSFYMIRGRSQGVV